MSISKRITTAAVAVSLIAGGLAPLSTSALADGSGWGDHGHGYQDQAYGYGRDSNWNTSDRRTRGWEQYGRQRDDDRAYRDYDADERARAEQAARAERAAHDERRENRKDKKIARGVAIGIGVLMLGAILSQAGNHHGDRHNY